MLIAAVLGVVAIRNIGMQSAEQMLRLLCESGQRNLNDNADAWEKINVAPGMAVYAPKEGGSVSDVVRRADKNMYENKFNSKRRAKKPA